MRDLFDASSAVLVRDAESLAYCRAYGFPTHNLRQCCDMALSMPIVGDESRSGVALHVPNMPRQHLETIMGVLASSPAGKYAERIHVIYDAPPPAARSPSRPICSPSRSRCSATACW